MNSRFVHLHLHSEYSIVDGLVRVKPLLQQAVALGMPAMAITDQGNLFGMVKFYREALRSGIKPIIGAELRVLAGAGTLAPAGLLLLCQDLEGYHNLTRLLTRSYIEGQSGGQACIHEDWLRGQTDGLIGLSCGRQGDIGQALMAGDRDSARTRLMAWRELFPGRFYLELQRTGRDGEEAYIDAAVELAADTATPVVASNDVRFLQREDFEAHEARVCIHEGRTLTDPRRPRNYSEQQYLRSGEEMAALFEDIPEAIENSFLIARRCNLELTLGTYYLPNYPVPDDEDMNAYFARLAREGLERRLQVIFDTDAPDFATRRQVYDARLETELGVISKMGFPGYFLIVADFIRWARDNGIPVGPGRGSGAGSLVAYALGITDLDPLDYDLLFERFLNPERVSMPDFDIDFCMDRRDEVIEYVADRYGRDHVSQIITYGSMAAKAVVRDVGRVLGHPYGFVDQIAKLIPFDLKMTLERALQEEETLRQRYQDEEDVRDLIDLARKLEGLTRNAGRHAGGVVIAPAPLTEFTALYCEQGASTPVTQMDMTDIEAIGLVKFDFLGLRTLTIIDWAVNDINRFREDGGEPPLDITQIPLDDPESYALIMRADTTAIFQLESRGMKELIKRLQPDRFSDLIALVALFRPGPLQSGMVDDYIDRKHGRARVIYPHPELEPILKPTYGVILYQEQVMQIAQVLAGYTLGGADMLRRAMGKKKAEEMARQRQAFIEGAAARGVDAGVAAGIFDLMEKFAGYGFNKSHSAAYALVAYQTAWLKAHYPAAFMAAVLSSDMDNTDKVVGLIDECRSMGLTVRPPDLNASGYKFTVTDAQSIRYGLGAVKGVGEAAIEGIIDERTRAGEFTSLFDLCRRVDTRKANRRVLEALIRAGAMDSLGGDRAAMIASLDRAIQLAEQARKDSQAGQDDLFGLATDKQGADGPAPELRLERVPPWSEAQRLTGEKETLGLYLTGHPINRYEQELRQLASCRLSELKADRKRQLRVAGLLLEMRMRNSRRGKMATLTLDDRSTRVEVTLYAEVLARYQELLVKDHILVIEGSCFMDDFTGQLALTGERVLSLDQARGEYARELCLSIPADLIANGFIDELRELLGSCRPGPCPVSIEYTGNRATARLSLGDDWRINLPDTLLEQLRERLGSDHCRVIF